DLVNDRAIRNVVAADPNEHINGHGTGVRDRGRYVGALTVRRGRVAHVRKLDTAHRVGKPPDRGGRKHDSANNDDDDDPDRASREATTSRPRAARRTPPKRTGDDRLARRTGS